MIRLHLVNLNNLLVPIVQWTLLFSFSYFHYNCVYMLLLNAINFYLLSWVFCAQLFVFFNSLGSPFFYLFPAFPQQITGVGCRFLSLVLPEVPSRSHHCLVLVLGKCLIAGFLSLRLKAFNLQYKVPREHLWWTHTL